MPESRDTLKSYFKTGFKPTQQNFEDTMDGMVNINDDAIEPTQVAGENYMRVGFGGTNTTSPPEPRIIVNGGVQLGGDEAAMAATPNLEGTLLYQSGVGLRLHDGTAFGGIGGGGGGVWSETTAGTETTAEFQNLQITHDSANDSVDFNANALGAPLSFSQGGIPVISVLASGTAEVAAMGVTTSLTLPSGEVIVAGSGPVINSDRRLKQDIKPYKDGLELIRKVNPVSYRFREGVFGGPKEEQIGIIAQEIKEVSPYLVTEAPNTFEHLDIEDNVLRVNARALNYALINSVKTLADQVDELREQVNTLMALNKK